MRPTLASWDLSGSQNTNRKPLLLTVSFEALVVFISNIKETGLPNHSNIYKGFFFSIFYFPLLGTKLVGATSMLDNHSVFQLHSSANQGPSVTSLSTEALFSTVKPFEDMCTAELVKWVSERCLTCEHERRGTVCNAWPPHKDDYFVML